MTLRELSYLIALADHGHLGRAAEACRISQPTLSTQLKKLEGDLGVVIFERTNKALNITPIGREIIDQARFSMTPGRRAAERFAGAARQLTSRSASSMPLWRWPRTKAGTACG